MSPGYDPKPSNTQAVVTSFRQGSRVYESRLNDCGKANCQKCGGSGRRHPSHGPYWYLCVQRPGGPWTRVYLGKHLDTSRYVLPDGAVDWATIIRERHATRKRISQRAKAAAAQDAADLEAMRTLHPDRFPDRPPGPPADPGGPLSEAAPQAAPTPQPPPTPSTLP